MSERHHHITHTAPDGTRYETCGFWEDEGQARDAILDRCPGHIIEDIETGGRCAM